MTKADIDKFIVQLEQKNSWGKNEVIDMFKNWIIESLLAQLPKQGETVKFDTAPNLTGGKK